MGIITIQKELISCKLLRLWLYHDNQFHIIVYYCAIISYIIRYIVIQGLVDSLSYIAKHSVF